VRVAYATALVLITLALLIVAYAASAVRTVGKLQVSYLISEADIQALEDEEYYHSVLHDLREAEEEVLVAMYSMIYDPDDPHDWANDLIEELAKARERGVRVKVLIEYRTYWGCQDENLEAYNYLKEHGVDVKLDYDSETDHVKLVVIDGRVAYVGSHNWSEAGLCYNREVTVRVVDEGIASELRSYFNELWGS